MAAYIFRRLLYNIPVFLGVILFVMAALRVHDPVYAYLGKNASPEQYEARKQEMGLDQPFYRQYVSFLGKLLLLDLEEESWEHKGVAVERLLRTSVIPSMSLTVPALAITTLLSVCMGMVSAFYRGRLQDKTLVFLAVLGMSVSLLVYIILGQYFGAYRFGEYLGKGNEWFAVSGYEPGLANWPYYCLLPVIISVIVAMGYDTRFYRAVMVEESNRDYITTARAYAQERHDSDYYPRDDHRSVLDHRFDRDGDVFQHSRDGTDADSSRHFQGFSRDSNIHGCARSDLHRHQHSDRRALRVGRPPRKAHLTHALAKVPQRSQVSP